MNKYIKYQQFLDEIGWEDFSYEEKHYFFEDIKRKYDGQGTFFTIESSVNDRVIIKYKYSEYTLEIKRKELSKLLRWVEKKYAGGEDGALFFDMKATQEREKMKEEKYIDEEIEVSSVEALDKNNKPDDTVEDNIVNIDGLANAVYLWLNYQTAVSASINLLHEASFRYPIAEFIERKMKSSAVLEEDPDIFYNRPTDFQWQVKDKRYFLECKFAKDNYTNKKHEFQRYIDDICRLYYCIEDKEKDTSYFLVCGHKKDVESCLLQDKESMSKNINKKRYNYFLDFNNGKYKVLTFDLSKADANNHDEEDLENSINLAYKSFKGRYEGDIPKEKREKYKLEEKITLTIKCKFAPNINKKQENNIDDPIAENNEYVYIWQIQKGKPEEVNNETIITD